MVMRIIPAQPLKMFFHPGNQAVCVTKIEGAIWLAIGQNIQPVFVLFSSGVVQATVQVFAQFILRTIQL